MLVAQVAISILEAYYVGWLGADALAGVSVTFPLVMLMQTMSAGGMGGGVASAVARALGSGRRADASRLVTHAIVIALVMASLFSVVVLGAGRAIYHAMGARAGALEAALAYSNVIFAGAAAVERSGVGLALDPNVASPDELADALRRMLELDPDARAALDGIAAGQAARPGPEIAFEALAGSADLERAG